MCTPLPLSLLVAIKIRALSDPGASDSARLRTATMACTCATLTSGKPTCKASSLGLSSQTLNDPAHAHSVHHSQHEWNITKLTRFLPPPRNGCRLSPPVSLSLSSLKLYLFRANKLPPYWMGSANHELSLLFLSIILCTPPASLQNRCFQIFVDASVTQPLERAHEQYSFCPFCF